MLHTVNSEYLRHVFKLTDVPYQTCGHLYRIPGHQDYNRLLQVNSVFSNQPNWWPVDRTQSAKSPLPFTVYRPWQPPTQSRTLDAALERRVQSLCDTGKICNILWSGGVDSTTALTAFLRSAPDIAQIRLLYSPWSTYEHPGYLEWVRLNYPKLDIKDISGDVYLDENFEGLLITGDGGDESMASLDESFYEQVGRQGLQQPWQDYFRVRLGTGAQPVIDWYDNYCGFSGRPIQSLLEARWWFYIACKTDSLLREAKIELLIADALPVDPSRLIGFFDCEEFLEFIYFNLDQIIADGGYAGWKSCLKKFCFDHNGFENWYQHKIKFQSLQLRLYYKKKIILSDRRWLAVMSNGEVLRTPNLPFLTRRDLEEHSPEMLALVSMAVDQHAD